MVKKHIKWPFYYMAKIKRTPGFLLKQVFLEEFWIVLLAFGIFLLPLNLTVFLSLCFLFAAMLSVYEIGYAENDRIGKRKEATPKLSQSFEDLGDFIIAPYAWLWALVFTTIGVFVLGDRVQGAALERLGLSDLGAGLAGDAAMIAIWLGLIGMSQLIFAAFNSAPLFWRVYLYVPLHVSKYLAPAIFFTTGLVGAVFLAAHIVRTWSLYAIRRAGGDMDFVASQFIRLVFLILILTLMSLTQPAAEIWSAWQTWLILAFCVLRAVPELYRKM
ncbi:MAG: hypothetical protein AAFR51_10520 [Pseudomonadota bacterium]